MTQNQEQLLFELIDAEIKKHSVKASNPTVQAWADGKVEDLQEIKKLLQGRCKHPWPAVVPQDERHYNIQLKDEILDAGLNGCKFTVILRKK